MTTPEPKCPRCGASLSSDAVEELCPACLLRQALVAPDTAEPDPQASDSAAIEAAGFGSHWSLFPAERYGDYRIEGELGRGGMGIIFRAHQVSLNRTVALKMILAGPLSSADFAKRLRIEAEAAGGLDHPNIVAIYEVGEHDGQPFFTMRLVEGSNLAQALKAGPFEPKRAATLIMTVARAIQHAHERGVLHRDLKPSNILLDAQGQPHVTDFGLAKIVHADSTLTLSQAALGTPSYMAPEQASGGSNQVTTAADVYSLGAILYELLTGRPLFQAETPLQAIQQVLEREPERPSRINYRVDRDLETICLKCLQKETRRRYESAAALADDLERWLASEPIQARPVGWIERRWLWCRRKPALAALVAALVLTVVVGSSMAGWRIAAARQQERLARQKEKLETYASSIAQADKFIQEGSPDRAMKLLLNMCPEELRHWEWGYLVAQCHQEILSIPAHTNRPPEHNGSCIRNLGFDSTGERLITCGFDGRIKVWNAQTSQEFLGLRNANLSGTNWAVHPAKQELAVGLTNGGVRRFDLSQERELAALALSFASGTNATRTAYNSGGVSSIAYAPGGESLAVAMTFGAILLWDLPSGRLSWSASVPVNSSQVFFSADGKQVIVQGQSAAWWLSRDSGSIRDSLQLDALQYWGLYVAPDGASQLRIGTTGGVELWPAAGVPRRLGAIVAAQPGFQRHVIFSRDGRLFCTGGDAGTARVFRVLTGEEVLTIPDRVFSGVFSPDGTRLVALMADRRVQVWDLERRAKAMTLRGHLMIVECAAVTQDGRRIATADHDGVVKIWSGSPGRSSLLLGEWPHTLQSSPDGRTIAASAAYHHLKIWNSDSGRLVRTLRARYDKPYASDLSPNGRWLVTVAFDPLARLWDVASGNLIGVFQGHTNALRAVRFSPDGRSLATADTAGTVQLWDVASRAQRLALTNAGAYIYCIEFNPTSDQAVITGVNSPPVVWNLKSGQVEHVLMKTRGAWSSHFTPPDGKTLAVAGIDGVLRLYDTASWNLMASQKSRGRSAGWMDFTGDGRRMALPAADAGVYGFDSGSIQIWDAEHWRELIAISGPPDLFALAYYMKSPRRQLVAANGDRMIYQWDAFPWRTSDYTGLPGTTLAERIRSYAMDYWQGRLTQEQEAIGVAEAEGSASPPIDDLFLPPRSPQCEPGLVNLAPHYNLRLDAWLYPTDDDARTDFSLSAFPAGRVTLLGVPFDARGVVLTRAFEPLGGVFQEIWECFPVKVEDIQVNQRVRKIHILHGTCPSNAVSDGTVVGGYVWHFADGTIHKQPIVYGRDLRDWWMPNSERPVDLERGRIAWTGDTPLATKSDARVRLYLTSYLNPRPELEVSHIDFVSKMTQAAPFLVAMTVEP